jgi:aminoglycoside phosphotransferase (APT) family kinase protein
VAAWTPEFVVGEEQARRLITGQFPDFERPSVRLLGEGWDNTVWLADERVVFRFPRRAMAVPGLQREIEVLPALASMLTLPIPMPTHLGVPAEGFPWPFFGAPLIEGKEPADAHLDEAGRIRLARPLGQFLRELHAIRQDDLAIPPPVKEDDTEPSPRGGGSPPVGISKLPADPMGRVDMSVRVPRAREVLAELAALGVWTAPPATLRVIDSAARLPPIAPTAVAHGDLHLRHVLVGTRGELAGVIDWNDVCRSHPSIDLVLYWSLLPPAGRSELLAAYGEVGEEDLLRARVLSFSLCASLAAYARHEGKAALEQEAVRGLALTARE